MEIVVKNLRHTEKFAKRFAKSLHGGERILLNGDLGAGKTTFVKFLAKYLKVKDAVTSPSFTILKQYEGKFKINHFDLYRIEDVSELQELGFYEYLDCKKDSILIIEWGERASLNRDEFICIDIEKNGEDSRLIRVN
jgi:tRNA threonylcarbamoyladenosine biosynthesis protein TsaE